MPGNCPAQFSPCGSPVENIPFQGERHSGERQKVFAFPPEWVFTFRTECCSESQRNGVRLQNGIAFAFDRIPQGIIEFVKSGAKTAEEWHPGIITKTFSVLSNSLDAQADGNEHNWFIYQFVDPDSHSCAVEWRIYKKVLQQYGPLLRGSLILAFHGKQNKEEQKGIRLLLRPQLGFIPKDELLRVTPTENLLKDSDQVQLVILPVDTPA